jgi:tRNA (pseudouridine54-N1)-methyltransferase
VRRFVILGQKARASADFLLADIPSTSGRLDVLLRALRASLLISHGVRRDTLVYLVLLGDPEHPRVLRFEGAASRYLRPDERSLANTCKKALLAECSASGFTPVRPGIAAADGGMEVLWPELGDCALYVLEPGALDIRSSAINETETAFILGDHIGFEPATRALLSERGARFISVGPIALYTEDVIAIVANELDRRAAQGGEATSKPGL